LTWASKNYSWRVPGGSGLTPDFSSGCDLKPCIGLCTQCRACFEILSVSLCPSLPLKKQIGTGRRVKTYLFVRMGGRAQVGGRGKGRSRLPAEQGALCRTHSIPGLWDHDLSQGQKLNQLSHLGSPPFLGGEDLK